MNKPHPHRSNRAWQRGLGVLLIAAGLAATGHRLWSYLAAPRVEAEITAITPYETECRRRSGRVQSCILQRLTVRFTPAGQESPIEGDIRPRERTDVAVGEKVRINYDPARGNAPYLGTLSGDWTFRLTPLVLGLFLLIYSTVPAPGKDR